MAEAHTVAARLRSPPGPARPRDLTPDRLEALLQASLHLTQARDLPELAEEALRRALEFSNCESGSIMLLSEDGAVLRIVAQVGLAPELAERYFPAGAGVAGIALRAKRPIFLRGAELSVEPRSRERSPGQPAPSVCIPLVTPQQRALGTLNLNAGPGSALVEEDAAVLDAMARQLAVLIENTTLRHELESHVEELVALYRASHLIVTGHEEEDALGVMLQIVAQALAASSVALFELAEDGSLHCIALHRGEGKPLRLNRERPRSEPLLIQRVISEAAIVPFGRWPGQGQRRGRAPVYGWLAALQSENRVIGLLEISLGGAGSPAPVSSRRLAGLINQVALALAHTRALERARTRERQLAVLLDRLITVEEEERLRLAHEIHDGLAQMLASAHQELQTVRESLDLRAEGLAQGFDRGLQILRQSLAEVRRVIGGLRPLVLEDFGLATAIREHLQQLQVQLGWQAELLTRLRSPRLPVAVEVGLYRIAQEALNNAARHSRARKVRVRLEENSNGIVLEVRDFGRGFQVEEARNGHGAGRHVGLAGMEERAKLLGGACQVTSAPGNGTRVRVELPRKSYR